MALEFSQSAVAVVVMRRCCLIPTWISFCAAAAAAAALDKLAPFYLNSEAHQATANYPRGPERLGASPNPTSGYALTARRYIIVSPADTLVSLALDLMPHAELPAGSEPPGFLDIF